jgi:NDP-sugar pyrophosphorylase family protein
MSDCEPHAVRDTWADTAPQRAGGRARGLAGISAMILAGGQGTRLRSVVADRSKVMARVGDRPFVTFLLDRLQRAGLRHAVMCTGHLGDRLRAELGERYGAIELSYAREARPLGTAGALRHGLPLARSRAVLAMNGDSFTDADLAGYWARYRASDLPGALLLTRVDDATRYGGVALDAAGRVVAFEEKGARRTSALVNAGVYFLTRDLILTIPPGRAVSLEREMLPRWTRLGLAGYENAGRFLDIGLPETYARAERLLAAEWQP